MIPEFGLLFLILFIYFVCFQLLFVFYILFFQKYNLIYGVKYLLEIQIIFIFLSICALIFCFVFDDFSVLYVYSNSNSILPVIYKISALWSSYEGSFFLFIFLFTFWIYIFFKFRVNSDIKLFIHVYFILNILLFIFSIFLLFVSNPFERILDNIPIDGSDLNPLLQDLGLIIHPPLLYMGYIGFSIPFSFCLSMLFLNKIKIHYFKIMYPWILFPFVFLTLGIVIGSWWAYYELGWGGWWFWDPVENAALVPWLSSLALIHSIVLNIYRNSFYRLTIILSILTFNFCLLGILLVRSGIIDSIHSFTSSDVRTIYLLLIFILICLISLFLYIKNSNIFYRKIHFKYVNKEIFLIFLILLLIISFFSILIGTYYPIFSDFLLSKKVSVGSPFFNTTVLPMLYLSIFIMPLALFSNKFFSRSIGFLFFILSILIEILIIYLNNFAFSILNFLLLFIGICAIVSSFLYIIGKNFSFKSISIGLSHLGAGIIVVGIILSTLYSVEKEVVLKINDSVSICNYTFYFNKILRKEGVNYISDIAEFYIEDNKKFLTKMYPEKRFFLVSGISMSETYIYPSVFYDLYIALGKNVNDDMYSFRIYYKPFVRWIWFGGCVISFSIILIFFNLILKYNKK